MGIYITPIEVRGKAVDDKITRANWTEPDIEKAIVEAESYVENRLIKIGYSRKQLLTVPLVGTLMINYARYVILRDIYTNIAPSVAGGEEYTKWRDEVVRILDEIAERKILLVNKDGDVIQPEEAELMIESTTDQVKRAITMAPSWQWDISPTYWDEKVVGKK